MIDFLPLIEVDAGLIGNVNDWPLILVVIDVACSAPGGLLTVMILPFRPVNVWPSLTVLELRSMPGITRLARVEAARAGVKRPSASSTVIASLVKENTVETAEGVARKLDRA